MTMTPNISSTSNLPLFSARLQKLADNLENVGNSQPESEAYCSEAIEKTKAQPSRKTVVSNPYKKLLIKIRNFSIPD